MTAPLRPLMAKKIFRALVDAGIVPENTARVVIDVNRGNVVMLYTEQYADERLLSVTTSLDGIQVELRPTIGQILDLYDRGLLSREEIQDKLKDLW